MFSKLSVSVICLATAMMADPSATPSSHVERQLHDTSGGRDPYDQFTKNFRGDAERKLGTMMVPGIRGGMDLFQMWCRDVELCPLL